MSRAPRRSTNSVSLFPFLAVLVSAMGALIFLLILTTSRIRSEALARAERERAAASAEIMPEAPPAPEPEPSPAVMPELAAPAPLPIDPDAELKQLVAALSREQADLRRTLEQQRRERQEAEGRAESAAAVLDGAGDKRKALEAERRRQAATLASLEEAKEQVPVEIQGLVRKIREVQQAKLTGSSKFAIVPYDGLSGTTRRPILIECTDKGLRFLPEDILLTPAQVDGYTEVANPLLAGAETLVKFWSARNRMVPESQRDPEPYVLMLVRPSGAMTYYYGRKLLANFSQPFGYELLDERQELALPAADPQATALCRAAIEDALQSRPTLARTSTPEPAPGGRELRFRPGGGFEVVERDDGPFGGGGRGPGGTGSGSGRGGPSPSAGGTTRGPFGNSPFGGSGTAATPPDGSGFAAGSSQSGSSASTRKATDRTSHGALSDADGRFDTAHRESQGAGVRSTTPQPSGSGNAVSGEIAARPAAGGTGQGTPGGLAERLTGDAGPESGSGSTSAAGEGGSERRPGSSGTGASGGQRSNSTGGAPGQPGGDAAADPFAQPPGAFPSFGQTASRPRSDSSRSRRWGHASPRATIGFEREMPIAVGSDRIEIGHETTILIDDNMTPEQLLQQVLAGIDREARAWGRPPENFYWVPSLRFLVSPGGNRHVERLRGPLSRWGLGSKVEYRLDAPERPDVQPLGTLPAGGLQP